MVSSRWARRPRRRSRPRLCAKTSRALRSSPHALGSQCPSTPRISQGSIGATPLSTANSSSMTRNGGTVAGRPKIGLLGIMQALYDEMLPGITERQAGYAKEVAIHLKGVAEVSFPGPAKSRAEIEDIVEGFEKEKLDGVMIVMLTYGPSMRATRALSETRLPLMLANIQPEPVVTPEWDMGDIRVDETDMLRELGPEINFLATGDLHRAMQSVSEDEIEVVLEEENRLFEVDNRLDEKERQDAARMQVAIKRVLDEGGYGAYSTHFDAIGEDGRFRRLPLAAASSLMAAGYGFGAEGDACSAALVSAGHVLAGDAHFTEMYALDFERDAVLMSHMGEGNWNVARDDERVRLIHRELGIGRLGPPPTFLFRIQPGPATLASLVPLSGGRFRLVVSEGEVIDSEVLPALEMPYGFFRPETGARGCLDGWLKNGGTHHQVMTMGSHAKRWQLFTELLGIEFVQV